MHDLKKIKCTLKYNISQVFLFNKYNEIMNGFMKAEQASKYQNTSNKELPLLEIFDVEYCGIIISI